MMYDELRKAKSEFKPQLVRGKSFSMFCFLLFLQNHAFQ